MRAFHSTWTLVLLLALPAMAQQQSAAGGSQNTQGYTVFLRGLPIGHQDVSVRSDAQGLTITGQGQIAAPLDIITRRAEVRYGADLSPESLLIDARINGTDITLQTTFSGSTAVSMGMQGVNPIGTTDTVAPQSILLPNVFLGAYAALARRLAGIEPRTEFHAFVGPGPGAQVAFRLRGEATEQMQTGTTTFDVHRYELEFDNAGAPLGVQLFSDNLGELVRVNMPAQGLEIIRDDIAGSISRTRVTTNPGDEAVVIPVTGFNLGATLTRPANAAGKLPAVVLIGGADSDDRDGMAFGVPILAQLAAGVSRAGFLAVRYDKRGYGQSGGRAESVTISDLAEDVRAIVKWLDDRKDIDPKRIVVLGHAEGAWVALLAASREKKIAAIVSIDAPSTTGAELALEQQAHALDQLHASPAERAQKVELQKKIEAAVLTGTGWDGVPANLRKQADTPWTQSVLSFDPAKVIQAVRQPVLFVHAELDRQVPVCARRAACRSCSKGKQVRSRSKSSRAYAA